MSNKQAENFRFKRIHLFKDQTLGIGSYGKVFKAECDGLLCAAKLIHETLFEPTALQQMAPHRRHRHPLRRFEQECEFLSTIRHPNIIQYLGMYQDPDTRLPVLLMELMDDSLTHFLESSPQPIPYHIQVNICHDVILAISFLHSNGVIHRDLSSNNVLMIGNIRAKVTDFGMASLGDMTARRASHLSFTMCPGTDVYMPPEAVKDKPVYTEKIDCFSFGVVTVQIMTRIFPKPGDRREEIQVENLGIVEKRVSERERRQNHTNMIDPAHPLLAVALDCLADEDVERPSARELCKAVGVLKNTPKYSVSIREVFQRKREIAAAGALELNEMSKEHVGKIRAVQTEFNEQIVELLSVLEEVKEDHSRDERQIDMLRFTLNEMKSTTLHKLCHDGNMKKIREYVNRVGDVMHLTKILTRKKGFSGYTPLHEAAASGKPEVLKYLLDLTGSANVDCRTSINRNTPLHLAASNGHVMCVRELLAHGADISCVDKSGRVPKAANARIAKILRSEGELTAVFQCTI